MLLEIQRLQALRKTKRLTWIGLPYRCCAWAQLVEACLMAMSELSSASAYNKVDQGLDVLHGYCMATRSSGTSGSSPQAGRSTLTGLRTLRKAAAPPSGASLSPSQSAESRNLCQMLLSRICRDTADHMITNRFAVAEAIWPFSTKPSAIEHTHESNPGRWLKATPKTANLNPDSAWLSKPVLQLCNAVAELFVQSSLRHLSP